MRLVFKSEHLSMKYLSRLILFLAGWKYIQTTPKIDKSVVCVAPHTSNWDFVFSKLAYSAMGNTSSHFFMKKEWFFFPLGLFFKALGGIPVDRSTNNSLTDKIAEEFAKREAIHFGIAPEGTRKAVTRWKRGFYHIALKANVPIQLAYIDYRKKECGITNIFYPTGNEEADMQEIKEFYKDITPRFPDRFHRIT